VHEIDDDGNIVYLTDLTTIPACDVEEEALKALPPPPEDEGKRLFSELIGEEQMQALYDYIKTAEKTKDCFKV
jgi:hypothetical protein